MENLIARQIAEAAATLLTGLSLGFLYEVFGEGRRRCGKFLAVVLDMIFCVVFATALFCLGMGPGDGQIRLYMPLLMMLGSWGWIRLFGAETRKIAGFFIERILQCFQILGKGLKKLKKIIKKFEKTLKKLFSSLGKRFTIIHNHATNEVCVTKSGRTGNGETEHETKTVQYIYEDSDSGIDRLCRNQLGQHQKPHRRRRSRPGTAAEKSGSHAAGKC